MPSDNYNPGMALRDYLKPYLRIMTQSRRKRFYSLCRSLLQSRSSVLSRAGRTRLKRKKGKKAFYKSRLDEWVKEMSRFLEAVPWKEFQERHFRRLSQRQKQWRLIVHDISDINKRWAKKMEGVSVIHDGSTGELVNGYNFCMSTGVGRETWDIHPIAAKLINPKAKDFESCNNEFKEQISTMLKHSIGHDCLHVLDRGFDDEKWFDFFDHEKVAWMIRLKDNRVVTFRGEKHSLKKVVETILSERSVVRKGFVFSRTDIGVTITHNYKGEKITPETRTYALVAVRRPEYQKPMMLLLNGKVKNVKDVINAYKDYLDRWDVEDCISFLKDSLNTEQMQLRTFKRLKNFLNLQILLVDFLLREYDKGVRPIGSNLREILQRSIQNDTRIVSPYLLAEHIKEDLLENQRHGDPNLVPVLNPQLSMFPILDTM